MGWAPVPRAACVIIPDDVREMLGIPSSTAIVLGISFGYEDPDVAANKARVDRVPVSDSVQFCDSV